MGASNEATIGTKNNEIKEAKLNHESTKLTLREREREVERLQIDLKLASQRIENMNNLMDSKPKMVTKTEKNKENTV